MAKREFPKKKEVVVPTETVETTEVVDEVIAEPIVETPKPTTGIVSGCNKLNIRKKPKTDAEVVVVVDKNTKLTVDTTNSTKDWFKVTTDTGLKGFCMKQFVTID